jgi:hypothetical protein
VAGLVQRVQASCSLCTGIKVAVSVALVVSICVPVHKVMRLKLISIRRTLSRVCVTIDGVWIGN